MNIIHCMNGNHDDDGAGHTEQGDCVDTWRVERAATLTEVLTCELHRQRELFLRHETADAVPGLERYEATVTFLHPGWAVADWYGGKLNDCRVFETQAEAEADLDARVEYDLADR